MTEEVSLVSVAVEETEAPVVSSPDVISAPAESPEPTHTPSARLEDLKPGMRLEGKVIRVLKFGAFVDVGVGQDGLVHISELEKEGLQHQISSGQELAVWVQHVDLDSRRLSLGLRQRIALRDLQVGSVMGGRVVRIEKFGAFVDIGATTDGLVHVSKYPGHLSNETADALKVGEDAKVKIESVDMNKRRISLTMRDLEPKPPRRRAARPPRQREKRDAPVKKVAYEDSEEILPTAMQIALDKAYGKTED